jgi:hypothetical protein
LPRQIHVRSEPFGAWSQRSAFKGGRLYIDYVVSADGQRIIAQEGELVLSPNIYPPIPGAEKVTPNMIPMENPTEQEAKNLSDEFRQMFFAQ